MKVAFNNLGPAPMKYAFCTGSINFLYGTQRSQHKNVLGVQLCLGHFQLKIVPVLEQCRAHQCHDSFTDQSKSRKGGTNDRHTVNNGREETDPSCC